jgi:hypothetical protein
MAILHLNDSNHPTWKVQPNFKGRHGPTSCNYSLHLKDGDSVQDHIKAMTENINEMD